MKKTTITLLLSLIIGSSVYSQAQFGCVGYFPDGGSDCDGTTGICCTGTVVVKPIANNISLVDAVAAFIDENKPDKIKDLVLSGVFEQSIGKEVASLGIWKEILTGLGNGTFVLEKTKVSKGKKSDSFVDLLVRRVKGKSLKGQANYFAHTRLQK